MSPLRRFVQSSELRIEFAVSKSARLYLQIFLDLVLTGLLALHFSDNCTPLWSDVSRGGTTVQDDSVDKSEIRAKSMRDVVP